MSTLSVGSSGDEVTQVQLLMRSLGYEVPITGVYDTALRDAVIEWQSRAGAPASGQWDPATHARTLEVLARPGGPGGPVMVPPTASTGMDTERWGLSRQIEALNNPTVTATAGSNLDGFAALSATLDYYGLGSMTEWAIGLLIQGTSQDEILLQLQQRPEFEARFPYNSARRAANPNLPAMSPQEMIEYEDSIRMIMRQAGFPPGFYDGPEDFLQLAVADLDPIEIQERVNNGYRQVQNAHPSVRQAFRDYFGIEGDVALAMLYIDPAKSEDTLIRMTEEAKVAASARRMDFSVSRPLVEELVRVGITEQDSSRIFGELNQVRSLFDEQLGEDQDLTVEGAVRTQAGLAGGQGEDLERRATRRVLRGSGAGGGIELEEGLQLGQANE